LEQHILSAQRYFPNYLLQPERSDIGLREYDLAAKALEADNRSLTAASGIALFVGGVFATLIGSRDIKALKALTADSGFVGLGTLACTLIVVAVLLTHYFALLQRSAVHASRKIVVLRRLLGIDYGNIETVLPADTLDGANEPFSIAMFPGWTSIQAIPTITVALVAGLTQAIVFAAFEAGGVFALPPVWRVPLLIGPITVLFIGLVYRFELMEDFETARFIFAKKIARFIRVPLKLRTGHVLYRLKLSIAEAARVRLDLKQMRPLLLHIEDRDYFKHNGNSARAAIGALYRLACFRKFSGGSTILHQLARSNFLESMKAQFGRKIVEWMIAPWLNHALGKDAALDAYLVSVRFGPGRIGLAEGIQYYFPDQKLSDPLPTHRKFVLIERLSNVSGTFPHARIRSLVGSCLQAGLILDSDIPLIEAAYRDVASLGRIHLANETPTLGAKVDVSKECSICKFLGRLTTGSKSRVAG